MTEFEVRPSFPPPRFAELPHPRSALTRVVIKRVQNKYRAEVRAKNARVTAEEGDRFPLPRLTTYGSMFSIWPRAVAAGAPPLSAEPGAGPMEVV